MLFFNPDQSFEPVRDKNIFGCRSISVDNGGDKNICSRSHVTCHCVVYLCHIGVYQAWACLLKTLEEKRKVNI